MDEKATVLTASVRVCESEIGSAEICFGIEATRLTLGFGLPYRDISKFLSSPPFISY